MNYIEKLSRSWLPYLWVPTILYVALSNVVNAQGSNATLPVHGRQPDAPTNVTISATNGVASVTNSAYRDIDGDAFKRWSYQWSPTKSDTNVASTNATYNIIPGQEIFVRVGALAATGFPDATRTSNWSEWSPGYKVDADIFTFGTCNSNNFVYSDRINTRAYVFIGRIYLNGTVVGSESNFNDLNTSTTVALNKPIRSFEIWHAQNPAISATNYYLEYTKVTYMDNTWDLIAPSPGGNDYKHNQKQIPSPFSATGRYAKGGRVVAIAACDHMTSGQWQGYTGIRFALAPV
ncbi:hypothetical protein [Aeromonas veronii]|uniref:hypothetical protein n=1 Tax=Aeromonas veronii TaxID=654 RepID=UPI002416A885|nr:hypothetical protein [Aeromonas veronii]WFO49604.1 hypothetical protein L1O00_11155 [Aeromonas veronii]